MRLPSHPNALPAAIVAGALLVTAPTQAAEAWCFEDCNATALLLSGQLGHELAFLHTPGSGV